MTYRRLLIVPTAALIAGLVWLAAHLVQGGVPLSIPAVVTTNSDDTKAPALRDIVQVSPPSVHKVGSTLHFSVATPIKLAKIQKVEFYADKTFVGTAYSAPYTVTVPEGSLPPGKHQVTATVFTTDSSLKTPPSTFTSSAPQDAGVAGDNPTTPPDTSAAPGPASPTTPTLDAPTSVQAVVQAGTVVLSWTAPSDQTLTYQVWRDGTQIATANSTAYTDTNVVAGTTYDYQIVAVDSAGNVSVPSSTAVATVPEPQTVQEAAPQQSAVPDAAQTPASSDV